jgi:hypothetical protein
MWYRKKRCSFPVSPSSSKTRGIGLNMKFKYCGNSFSRKHTTRTSLLTSPRLCLMLEVPLGPCTETLGSCGETLYGLRVQAEFGRDVSSPASGSGIERYRNSSSNSWSARKLDATERSIPFYQRTLAFFEPRIRREGSMSRETKAKGRHGIWWASPNVGSSPSFNRDSGANRQVPLRIERLHRKHRSTTNEAYCNRLD